MKSNILVLLVAALMLFVGVPTCLFWIGQAPQIPLAKRSENILPPEAPPARISPTQEAQAIRPAFVSGQEERVDPTAPGNSCLFGNVRVEVLSLSDQSGLLLSLTEVVGKTQASDLEEQLFRTKWGWELFAEAQRAATAWAPQ